MNKPMILAPAYKDYLWGGNRLNDVYEKNIACYPLAETWECSTHPDGYSIISSGINAGRLLIDVIRENPDILGTHVLSLTNGVAELPIIVKLIDANKDLSIQVHPNDDYALKYEHSHGKTEMWYVLSSKKDSQIVYGFNSDMNKEMIRKSICDGTISKSLNYVPIKKDNVFFIEPGLVHAIGAGALIAEIQENSNITYRLYDYNRIDKKGKQRELHIDKALDVVKLTSSSSPRQPMRVLKYNGGCAYELLGRCKYFQVERMLLNTEIYKKLFIYKTDSSSFHVLLCLEGCGVIMFEKEILEYFKGDCIFIPANSTEIKMHGKAIFLNINS